MGNPVDKNILPHYHYDGGFPNGQAPKMLKVYFSGVETIYSSWPPFPNGCYHIYFDSGDNAWLKDIPVIIAGQFEIYIYARGGPLKVYVDWTSRIYDTYHVFDCGSGLYAENGIVLNNRLPIEGSPRYNRYGYGQCSCVWYDPDSEDSITGVANLVGVPPGQGVFYENIPQDDNSAIHRYAKTLDSTCIRVKKPNP